MYSPPREFTPLTGGREKMMQGSLTGSMFSRSQSGNHNGEETNLGNSGGKMNRIRTQALEKPGKRLDSSKQSLLPLKPKEI